MQARIERNVLKRVGTTGIVGAMVVLSCPRDPAWTWADGETADGRTVVVIGTKAWGTGEAARTMFDTILELASQGEYPEGVAPIIVEPLASRAIVTCQQAQTTTGAIPEILLYGERGTGKTVTAAINALIVAERHARAGYSLPLRALWVHDSLLSAEKKTEDSLCLPFWQGIWRVIDDHKTAQVVLAGRVYLNADFAGATDESAQNRLRTRVHHVMVEEVVPSLQDGEPIAEVQYELALSSMMREGADTAHKIAVLTTNPGSSRHWAYQRFLSGKYPWCQAVWIKWTDRFDEAARQRLIASYSSNPLLQRRLGMGEWVELAKGPEVAEGFSYALHVATDTLLPQRGRLVVIGWDGGHSPSAVIGQVVDRQYRVYAALNEQRVGTLQLIESQVLPWLREFAPWALERHGAALVHVIDPNMATPGQASITDSAERVLYNRLGGQVVRGPVRWAPRREAVLAALRPGHADGRPLLLISPTHTSDLLAALAGQWYYPTVDGLPDRSHPKKPNSPWADLGDAFANLLSFLQTGEHRYEETPMRVFVETAFRV